MGFFDFFSTNKEADQDNKLITRQPRVSIDSLHNISFDAEHPFSCKDIKLANISSTGIGFIKECSDFWPEAETVIEGTLKVLDHQTPMSARIIHITSDIAGCHFTKTSQPVKEILNKYFEVELAAMKMTKVSPEYLKKESDGDPIWFRGSDNCDLFLVASNNHIIRFNISFFGNNIEWQAGESDDSINKPRFTTIYSDKPSDFFTDREYNNEWQKEEITEELAACAIKFLNNIIELEIDIRKNLYSIIKCNNLSADYVIGHWTPAKTDIHIDIMNSL